MHNMRFAIAAIAVNIKSRSQRQSRAAMKEKLDIVDVSSVFAVRTAAQTDSIQVMT